jgi:hypothetical protein
VRFKAIGKFIRSSKLILAMSVDIYGTANAALEKDDRPYLNNILTQFDPQILISDVYDGKIIY